MYICFNLNEKNLYMDLERYQLPDIGAKVHIRFKDEKTYIKRVVANIEKCYSESGCMINFKLQEIKENE